VILDKPAGKGGRRERADDMGSNEEDTGCRGERFWSNRGIRITAVSRISGTGRLPAGHAGTSGEGNSSSEGPDRSRRDTRGHAADTVRDREARGIRTAELGQSMSKASDLKPRLYRQRVAAPIRLTSDIWTL
jgi:hypothetical protein